MINWRLGGTADSALVIHVLRGRRGELWLDLVRFHQLKAEELQAILWNRRN